MLWRTFVLLVPLVLFAVWVASKRPRHARSPLELQRSRQRAELASHRTAVGWRWAGIVVGVPAAFLTASVESLGLGVMLAPTVFGLFVIAGVVVGELMTTPPRDGVRTASLKTRSVGHYLPRRLSWLVMVSTLGLVAVLVTTTRMGSADDVGRAGRSLFRACSPVLSAKVGPWPGLFYSLPLGFAVAVGLTGAAVALSTVVLQPRIGSAPGLVAADDVLCQRSAEAVVAAVGVMVAASLLGVALTAASALIGFSCAPLSWTVLGVALLGVAALMLILAGWCLALLLRGPGIRPLASGDSAEAGQAVR